MFNQLLLPEIHDRGWDVSCVLPAWMANQAAVNEVLVQRVSGLFPGRSRVTCELAPTACLAYYLSRTRKPDFADGDGFLHCSLDEVFSVS